MVKIIDVIYRVASTTTKRNSSNGLLVVRITWVGVWLVRRVQYITAKRGVAWRGVAWSSEA